MKRGPPPSPFLLLLEGLEFEDLPAGATGSPRPRTLLIWRRFPGRLQFPYGDPHPLSAMHVLAHVRSLRLHRFQHELTASTDQVLVAL